MGPYSQFTRRKPGWVNSLKNRQVRAKDVAWRTGEDADSMANVCFWALNTPPHDGCRVADCSPVDAYDAFQPLAWLVMNTAADVSAELGCSAPDEAREVHRVVEGHLTTNG